MANDDFLKKLQESLHTGEKNDEVVDHLKEIDEKADELTFQKAAENLDKRVEESGSITEMSEEERDQAEEEYAELLAAQQENDEKLRFLANIEERNVAITRIKKEFEEVKKDYSIRVKSIHEQKITLMAEFEKKYGKKTTEEHDFGTEPSTEIE